jgi:predicted GNAT family N-acyltransferase
MVVIPKYQGHGLGMRILQALIEVAVEQGASLLTLNARTTKVLFYQKAGFETIGEVFASKTTAVPHIKMQKKL